MHMLGLGSHAALDIFSVTTRVTGPPGAEVTVLEVELRDTPFYSEVSFGSGDVIVSHFYLIFLFSSIFCYRRFGDDIGKFPPHRNGADFHTRSCLITSSLSVEK